MLMEKQMQYAATSKGPELITQEEWLMFQDIPNREYMLERMGLQRMQSSVEDVTQTLFEYANLVKSGVNPDDAIMATAQTMDNKRKGIMPEEPIIPPAINESQLPPMGGAPQPPPMF